MTVNHDVVGSSPTGGVSTRKGFLFSFYKYIKKKVLSNLFFLVKENIV